MGSLKGVRLVEIANAAPVPFACMILADLGADVLRVERAKRHKATAPNHSPQVATRSPST